MNFTPRNLVFITAFGLAACGAGTRSTQHVETPTASPNASSPAATMSTSSPVAIRYVFTPTHAVPANGPRLTVNFPREAIPDQSYQPVTAAVSPYTVDVSADRTKVTVHAADGSVLRGERESGHGADVWYDLNEGTFAGGRFVLRAGGREAELTIYGSGVPVVSSVRGTLAAVSH